MGTFKRHWWVLFLFVGGFFLGAAVPSAPSDDMRVQGIELTVTRNSERIEAMARDLSEIHSWILASDRQKIIDAESEGGYHARVEAHDWAARVVIGACAVNLVGLIFLFVMGKKSK